MIIVSQDDTNQRIFGSGADGSVSVTGTVDIKDLYENDSVSGVTTYRGVGKGLNHGAGSYQPILNKDSNTAEGVPNCVNFTVEDGAVLTCTALGTGSDTANGVIWIAATNQITITGTVQLSGKGFSGGTRAASQLTDGNPGYGPGHGNGSNGINAGASGAGYSQTGGGGSYGGAIPGGSTYGTTGIATSTWDNIYGSGGGSGYRGSDPSNSNPGGAGGGALRLYGIRFYMTGTIECDGENGVNGNSSGASNGGWSGGGSGGSVFIQTVTQAAIGNNLITASGGTSGGADQLVGGAGSPGRIHIEGAYTGFTSDPAIA